MSLCSDNLGGCAIIIINIILLIVSIILYFTILKNKDIGWILPIIFTFTTLIFTMFVLVSTY